ncbi:hypothetical protein ACQEVB_05970 [Pseudonocardia sp. CA-107938]|uniref:hypothetical protein n=1 Tax=Pseudonocardia sp. CA-107938 TaxID=3240021 RepID=UPI003D907C19
MDPSTLDDPFLAGAATCRDFLHGAGLAARWATPSALPAMSTGALACHLSRQVTRAAELLVTPSDLPVLDAVDEHYARAAWVTSTSPDDPENDRTTDDAEAALGHAAMLTRLDEDLATVTRILTGRAALDVVPIPWQGWALHRPDFLCTRLLEIVVHSADLAASLGTAAPEFPDAAFGPVRDLLARLAVRRHGQAAVVSTLTRRERAQPISAF